jgi:hypothetical protein
VLLRWTARLNTAPRPIGDAAVRRMIVALQSDAEPVEDFGQMDSGAGVANPLLAEFIRALLAAPRGAPVAADILAMRCHSADRVPLDNDLRAAARETLEAFFATDLPPVRETDLIAIAQACLVGPEGEASAKRLAKRLVRGDRDVLTLLRGENLPALILTRYPKVGLDAFLGSAALSSLHLEIVIHGRDDDDDPDQGPLGRIDAAVLREWVLRKPAVRAPRLAKHIAYWQTIDGRDVWTPMALWLPELPGTVEDVSNEFEMRFISGSWSGSESNRYLRRLPLPEALIGHVSPQVSAWAKVAYDRLRASIAEAEDKECRSNARFE